MAGRETVEELLAQDQSEKVQKTWPRMPASVL